METGLTFKSATCYTLFDSGIAYFNELSHTNERWAFSMVVPNAVESFSKSAATTKSQSGKFEIFSIKCSCQNERPISDTSQWSLISTFQANHLSAYPFTSSFLHNSACPFSIWQWSATDTNRKRLHEPVTHIHAATSTRLAVCGVLHRGTDFMRTHLGSFTVCGPHTKNKLLPLQWHQLTQYDAMCIDAAYGTHQKLIHSPNMCVAAVCHFGHNDGKRTVANLLRVKNKK